MIAVERSLLYFSLALFMWSFTSFGGTPLATSAGGILIGLGIAVYVTREYL